jgi:hypothetical protein
MKLLEMTVEAGFARLLYARLLSGDFTGNLSHSVATSFESAS